MDILLPGDFEVPVDLSSGVWAGGACGATATPPAPAN
jgi:hypothetical protein